MASGTRLASEAIAAGDGAEEVSWQLGHKNSVVTRAIYVRQPLPTDAPDVVELRFRGGATG